MLSHVREWQTALGTVLVDGVFGEKTLNASLQAIGQLDTKPIEDNNDTPTLPDGNITTHFERSEFERRAVVPLQLLPNLKVICGLLEQIRLIVNDGDTNGNTKLIITSGYRTQAQNDALYNKVNKRSMHVLAGAADIISPIGREKLGLICIELHAQGIIGGLGIGLTCIHVDGRGIIDYTTVGGNNGAIWKYGDKTKFYPSWITLLKKHNLYDRL